MPNSETATFTPLFGVKLFRESITLAQQALNRAENPDVHVTRAIATLQDLLDQCEHHRPTGADGKHDYRHTETCGCQDK